MARYLVIAKDKYGNTLGQDDNIVAQGVSDAEIQFNIFSAVSSDETSFLEIYKLEKIFDYTEVEINGKSF